MNYLAHGIRFLDRPYFLAGTAVPDWLSVVARKVRIRAVRASEFVEDQDACLAELARGICQHHEDDRHFHSGAAFCELQWGLAAAVRDVLGSDKGMRPALLGHVLVEVLLDAVLAERFPQRIDAYYQALACVDPGRVQACLGRLAPRPVPGCDVFLRRFLDEQFLYDYARDGKLLMRLSQVMQRVGLDPLPARLARIFPAARKLVAQRCDELLGFQPDLLALAAPRGAAAPAAPTQALHCITTPENAGADNRVGRSAASEPRSTWPGE